MQISCPRKELHDAVQFVAQGVSSRTTYPILSNLLLEGRSDAIRLVGTDHEIWVERTIPSIVGETGVVTVPARTFSEILAGLPEGEVKLTTGDRDDVRLECARSRYSIMGMNALDFPPVPEPAEDSGFTIPISLLRDLSRQVGIAVSRDDAREALTGMLFHCDGSEIRLVATDTHRLALRTAPAASAQGIGGSVSAVIRERAIKVITGAPIADDQHIRVQIDGDKVLFELPGVKVVASLLAGAFPAYERVIPTEASRRWTIPTEELAAALKRADIVAKENSHRVVMRAEGEKLNLSAKSEGLGDVSEDVEIASEGEDMAIAFSAKYLLDGLGVVDSEGVVLEMTEPLRPALLKPATENPDFLYVVMPMALS